MAATKVPVSEWTTLAWVARRLEKSECTVRRLADAGVLNVQRAENGWRLFDRLSVEAYAARNPKVRR
jgi:hypothetical protein